MFGKNYLKPLLFDEILTISLYGTEAELKELEACLEGVEQPEPVRCQCSSSSAMSRPSTARSPADDSAPCNGATERAVVELAERVRARLLKGLRSTCCDECLNHRTCVQKWLRAERGMRSTCCFRCHNFAQCSEGTKRCQLRKVARESKVREDGAAAISPIYPLY